MKMITYKEFLTLVDQTYKNFNWRYGQSLMNVLYTTWPEKYNELITNSNDCYYDENKISIVLDELKKSWRA